MDVEPVFRGFQTGDESNIVSLLQFVFTEWPHQDLESSSLEHWKWKYLANPIGAHYSFVSLVNAHVIGCIHAYPMRLKVYDKVLICA